METANLKEAYEGSYYTILGTGGELSAWTDGIANLWGSNGIGAPKAFYQTTGQAINDFARTKGSVGDPFPDDLTVIMVPLDGLHAGPLALFRLVAGDRWFDDIVNNMMDYDEDDEDGS